MPTLGQITALEIIWQELIFFMHAWESSQITENLLSSHSYLWDMCFALLNNLFYNQAFSKLILQHSIFTKFFQMLPIHVVIWRTVTGQIVVLSLAPLMENLIDFQRYHNEEQYLLITKLMRLKMWEIVTERLQLLSN